MSTEVNINSENKQNDEHVKAKWTLEEFENSIVIDNEEELELLNQKMEELNFTGNVKAFKARILLASLQKEKNDYIKSIQHKIRTEHLKVAYTIDAETQKANIDDKYMKIQVVQSFATSNKPMSMENANDIWWGWVRYRNIANKINKPFTQMQNPHLFYILQPVFKIFNDGDMYDCLQVVFPEGHRIFIFKLERDLGVMGIVNETKTSNPDKITKFYFCSLPHEELFLKYMSCILKGDIDSICAHETMRLFLSPMTAGHLTNADDSIKKFIEKHLTHTIDKNKGQHLLPLKISNSQMIESQ